MTGITIAYNHSGVITRKECLMRKQTCLYSQIGLLSHISPFFILIELHRVAPFGLQPYNTFGKCFLKTMETKKRSFLIFPRGRNNDNVVQISSLTNIAPS